MDEGQCGELQLTCDWSAQNVCLVQSRSVLSENSLSGCHCGRTSAASVIRQTSSPSIFSELQQAIVDCATGETPLKRHQDAALHVPSWLTFARSMKYEPGLNFSQRGGQCLAVSVSMCE